MARLKNPSRYCFIADSYHGGYEEQLYRISAYTPGDYNNSLLHLRHNNQANLLFADDMLAMQDKEKRQLSALTVLSTVKKS